MSNRIPTNIFGGALIQGGSQGLTLPQADQRYLNVSTDKMQGTLDMNNQPIKNLRTPEGSHEPTTKAYVDGHIQSILERSESVQRTLDQKTEQLSTDLSSLNHKSDQLERQHATFAHKSSLSELRLNLNDSIQSQTGKVQIIKFKLVPKKGLVLKSTSGSVFIFGLQFKSSAITDSIWHDQSSYRCSMLQVDLRVTETATSTKIIVFCYNRFIPGLFTGEGRLLIMEAIVGPPLEIPISTPTIPIPGEWVPAHARETRSATKASYVPLAPSVPSGLEPSIDAAQNIGVASNI